MGKSRIFIASSDRALGIAEKLRDELQTPFCEAEIWKDVSKDSPSQTRIERLEELVREYDFAVIILPKADVMATASGEALKARDNCLFEAGLFMATIGRRRCLFVSSVESESDLPSDLNGILLFRFAEPDDLEDRMQCRKAVAGISGSILDQVQQAQKEDLRRGRATRPLSRSALLAREKRETEGGELKEDQVVVASIQPLELGYAAALQVWNNIDSNIRYVYFFQGNNDAAEKIPQLLQLVLLARFLRPEEESLFQRRSEIVKTHQAQILEDLRDICLKDKIKVYFLPQALDVEYCIHNAASDKAAKLYVKHRDEFMEWESGLEAYRFWCEMREKQGAENPRPPDAVFHGARGFNLEEAGFLRKVRMEMWKYFPGIGEQVLKLCLAGPET